MKPAADVATDPLLASAPLLEGFRVLEPAVLYAKIGGGGMGAVYRGRHFSLECDVAVKVLKADLAHDEQFVSRFEREARLAARIKNDNVVQVLDVRHKNGIHYLVMEFVKGETARGRVQRKGPLAEHEALAILLGATRGLRAAHQEGIVHRDVKPDNVLISADGAVKLADLGLAKQKQNAGGESLTVLASGVMGTPQYMPPEQWKSSDVKPAADVWALGATLWYLLVGKSAIKSGELLEMADQIRNHDFPDLAAARPDVRPEVVALLAKCTRRDPAERYADARELLAALKPLCRDDEEQLRDGESGAVPTQAATVTPPPRSTLAKIKLQVAQGEEPTVLSGSPNRSEQPTIPPETVRAAATTPPASVAATATVVRPPRRSAGTFALVFVVLIALGVAGYGASAGWFATRGGDDRSASSPSPAASPTPTPTPSPPKAPSPGEEPDRVAGPESSSAAAKAQAALARARELLPMPNEIDAAITALEEALQHDGQLAEAKRSLALALVRKARDLEASDLDGAYQRLQRALVLVPGEVAAAEAEPRLAQSLRDRLLAGLTLVEPAADFVSGARELRVRGGMSAPKAKAVRVALVSEADAPAPFPRTASIEAPIVAGEWDVRVPAANDGRWRVRVEAEDVRGLVVELPPRVVVVMATLSTITIDAPAADAWVRSPATITGTVGPGVDTVRVADQPATVVDGRFRAEVRLADGAHDVVVVGRDALGREATQTHAVRVDSTAPVLDVADAPTVGNAQSAAVKVRVDDKSPVTVRIGGAVVGAMPDGSFAKDVVLAEDGEHEIVVEAVDAAGNEARRSVRVRRDTTAPVLAWQAPTVEVVAPGDLEITGTIVDASPCDVLVNGTPAKVTGGTWSARVQVPLDATLAVAVTARDAAGNDAAPLAKSLRGEVTSLALAWADPVPDAPFVVVAGVRCPTIVVERVTGMRMRLIAPGTFTMGSPASEAERGNDETAHPRVIRQPFWLGETEVTQAQWQAVMGTNPSKFRGDDLPVDTVSWFDCQAFVQRLSERAGAGFRMPSEAEWEYACRAGTTTPFSFGDAVTTAEVNFDGDLPYAGAARGDDRQRPLPAGSLPANPWGLCEMHGNLGEWCADSKAPYPGSGTEQPTAGEGNRVFRGGTWYFGAGLCRSADRHADEARLRVESIGFRLARSL